MAKYEFQPAESGSEDILLEVTPHTVSRVARFFGDRDRIDYVDHAAGTVVITDMSPAERDAARWGVLKYAGLLPPRMPRPVAFNIHEMTVKHAEIAEGRLATPATWARAGYVAVDREGGIDTQMVLAEPRLVSFAANLFNAQRYVVDEMDAPLRRGDPEDSVLHLTAVASATERMHQEILGVTMSGLAAVNGLTTAVLQRAWDRQG